MSDLIAAFRYASLPAEAEALRPQVRAFLREHCPPEPPHRRARSWMGFDASFSQRLAQRGWVGVTLPKRYGGAEMNPLQRFVLVEELLNAGAPVAAHWIAERQSGPLLVKFGSLAQRDFFLPRICAGQAFFCIGMSEPNSGSDLASVRSKAVRADGGWRLDGRKIWTTNAHQCHYMIALVRTCDEGDDRRQGLSQFVIDMKAPGVSVRPLKDITGQVHFNEVLFDNVRLGEDALLGQEGQGWTQVNAELAFERSGPERIYSSIVLLDLWLQNLRTRGSATGHETLLGRFATHLAALRLMSVALTTKLAHGESPVVEAALMKDLGTTFEQSVPALLESVLGAQPPETLDPEMLRTLSYLSLMAPSFSLRGGTREILRGMIARGLGLR